MELKLNVYTTDFCRKVEKTVTAECFDLSVGICEDVLNVVNVDMFDGGLKSLDTETLFDVAVGLVRNGFPYFRTLIKEIFELTDEEVRRTKISEVAKVVVDIVMYSFKEIKGTISPKKAKN